MSLQELDQPPPYPVHDLQSLKLPSLPTGTLPSRPAPAHSLPTLEPLPKLDAALPPPRSLDVYHTSPHDVKDILASPLVLSGHQPSKPIIHLPPLAAKTEHGLLSKHNQLERGLLVSNPKDDSNATSRRDASVSMDDPDDRMAAEALCGLGKIDSNRSQVGYETPLQYYPIDIEHTRPGSSNDEPEPLLSLLTSSHPWLGGTINGSLSAYSSTKSHSPRFVQYGADLVERAIGAPMANTVGSVGRRTGVEESIRRYLDARKSADPQHPIDPELLSGEFSSRKRKLDDTRTDGLDLERGVSNVSGRRTSIRSSMESLPPYDDNRSPAYDDDRVVADNDGTKQVQQQQAPRRPAATRSWSSQLMISTSGLGAALNDASLKSLKYCLTILRGANSHVRILMDALRQLLEQHERGHEHGDSGPEPVGGDADAVMTDAGTTTNVLARDQESESIVSRVKQLNDEIWNTLKAVVTTVSRYTGGALPENASVIVRWQLMSVPRRWQRAVSQCSALSNTRESGPSADNEEAAVGSARRMMAFAIEGLDMMEQVGGVVDSTIVSAEKWLDSMGRKCTEGEQSGAMASTSMPQHNNVKMSEATEQGRRTGEDITMVKS